MANHFRLKRRSGWWSAAAVVVALGVVGGGAVGGFIATRSGGHKGHGTQAVGVTPAATHQAKPKQVTTTTAPPPPPPLTATLTSAVRPTGVDGSLPIVFATGAATVDTAASTPTISPAVAGKWTATPGRLQFTPTDALSPATTYTVTLPAGLRSTAGNVLPAAKKWSVATENGSTLRLQQLLASLGYLPIAWTPASAASGATPVRDVYHPPAGQFKWTWASPPPTLAATWAEGQFTTMTKGAVMAFESDHGLATDGSPGHAVWAALLASSGAHPVPNPHGYTYALASKNLPETLTVWHNGVVISTSGANTGIPVTPTADGTFPVYERLATQIMKGTNPDGTKYADPVAWVAYFNGGDAIHYIARGSYGYPQSLGCVEIAYSVGAHIWPYLSMGSLVTVA